MSDYVPTPEEQEKRRRIRLASAAWSYERLNVSLITDAEFDRDCLAINLAQSTGNDAMDAWWRENFDPSTGMWVNTYPNSPALDRIARMRAALL